MNTSETSQPTQPFASFDDAFRLWRQTPWTFVSADVEERLVSYVPNIEARRAVRKLMGVDGNTGYPALVFTDRRSTDGSTETILSKVSLEITGLDEPVAPFVEESTDPRAWVLARLNQM